MMKVLSLVNQTKDQCANLRRSANLLLHENKIAYFTRDYRTVIVRLKLFNKCKLVK